MNGVGDDPARYKKQLSSSAMSSLPPQIACSELQALSKNGADFLLIDCREADEHALVALPDSKLLPMSSLAEQVSELENHKGSHLVVYCHLGVRSQRVANWLRDQGFEKVQSLTGGIDRWAEEIEPEMVRY
ncbi:rhodanese-like domain-containing protein [Bythopirellula goksoeyrii]|uniref:Putative adenylyltransferase/sulfurtransferase MoeZ n=1 Tax=Bythopirellula goksoeyrii TaxID=1400387 RepID=A0A5B9Q8F0_9BACT|nr:rhodanese-like domain-containing protein [Bythopirellula goksoeyrii]QEG35178.1 putative adenylyltransferase/sulfurtransferase MoeZ [Bythopirellula goksoeyrii]